ncbi:MAG TPA: ankyrin repeat domain-containing protein [Chitinophagaceae bacterium]|nr:ankyrin repeat domain-containing protein [Chitinophagaceae bacterium]
MIQPNELKLELPMSLSNGIVSTTTKVWDILVASKNGDLEAVKKMVEKCPELIYAQYNYTPPIHFAVREGHLDLVSYLLTNGAHDPAYKTYPFLDSLQAIAEDRDYNNITLAVNQYADNTAMHKYKGDNGEIHFERTDMEKEFEEAVNKGDLEKTEKILKHHPGLIHDETFFWGEGILMMPCKEGNFELAELLMNKGARVPHILKWARYYYFERLESAAFLLQKGMNPNVMSWHHVTILHDMAQKGDIAKAELLIKHGAEINAVDGEYQSTPLGMAVRWGHIEMVEYLLKQGADPNRSGAPWSTPLKWAKKKEHNEIENVLRKAGTISD